MTIPFTEVTRMQLKLHVESECGEVIDVHTPVAKYNDPTPTMMVQEFDALTTMLRSEMKAFLERQAIRRANWKG